MARRLHGAKNVHAALDFCEQLMMQVRSKGARHDTGTVYTPQNVVDRMVEDADPASFDHIIDTGCGCGRFAITAAQKAPEVPVTAVDLDPLACLLTATVAKSFGFKNVTVRRGDFLRMDVVDTGRTLFIGNPPYVRHHILSREDKTLGRTMANSLGLSSWSELAGLYALFIERCLCLAQDGDRIEYVTGAEWLDVGYGSALREAFCLYGGSSLTYYPATMNLFHGTMSTALISRWDIGSGARQVACALDHIERTDVDVANLRKAGKWGCLFGDYPPVPEGVKLVRLGDLFRVSRGVVTGDNAYFVVRDDDELATSMGARAVPVVARATDVPKTGRIEARTLRKRLLQLDGQEDADYLRLGHERGVDQRYVCSHRNPWYQVTFKPAPVLATYMRRGRPRFALNPDACANLNTVHGLHPKRELSANQLVRIVKYLNTGKLYGDQGRQYQGGLVKYEPHDMEDIEIPASVLEEGGPR